MKRFMSMVFVLFLFLSPVILYSPVSAVTKISPAVTGIPKTPTPSPAITPTEVEYSLPYPGILTNHPLYFLKYMRDMVLENIITDPVKKLEFSLLQSDKFFAMAMKYAEKNDFTNQMDAVNRSIAQREKALRILQENKTLSAGQVVPVVENLVKSTARQRELLLSLSKQAPTNGFDTVRTALETVEKQQETLTGYAIGAPGR